MSHTNACNIQEDEVLVEEVQTKYPCFYDKSVKGYKGKEKK